MNQMTEREQKIRRVYGVPDQHQPKNDHEAFVVRYLDALDAYTFVRALHDQKRGPSEFRTSLIARIRELHAAASALHKSIENGGGAFETDPQREDARKMVDWQLQGAIRLLLGMGEKL